MINTDTFHFHHKTTQQTPPLQEMLPSQECSKKVLNSTGYLPLNPMVWCASLWLSYQKRGSGYKSPVDLVTAM